MKKFIFILMLFVYTVTFSQTVINKKYYGGFTITMNTVIGSTYLIQWNGHNSIAPFAGTGYPVTFGNFYVTGTYRVLTNGIPSTTVYNIDLIRGKYTYQEVTIDGNQFYLIPEIRTHIGDSIIVTKLIH